MAPKGLFAANPPALLVGAELHHNRLERHTGLQWMADFLDCVVATARTGLDQLERLQRAEGKVRMLAVPRDRTSKLRPGQFCGRPSSPLPSLSKPSA